MSMMGMSGTQDVTSTMVYIILNEDKADNGKIIAKKMDKLAKKYNCEIVTSADMDMSSMMGGSGVDIKLYSEDLTKLRSAGIAIESKLKGMKSLEDVSTIDEDSSEELHVVVNKNLAMKQGLSCLLYTSLPGGQGNAGGIRRDPGRTDRGAEDVYKRQLGN